MARTTIGKMMRGNIYAFVYGREGVGKTNLITTVLTDPQGLDLGIVTAESSGPTSLVNRGYSPDIACELLPPSGEDPFPVAVAAIQSFTKDPKIKSILVDGTTVICGRAVDHFGNGDGEKALGWEGWAAVLNGFRQIEAACEKASRAGKNVVITAWENPPKVTDNGMGAGSQVAEIGRPLLQGKASTWLPGNCDIVARLTSRYTKNAVGGKTVMEYKGTLQVHATDEWLAKTRWALPEKCPADLKWILSQINGQQKAANPTGPKPVAKLAAKK